MATSRKHPVDTINLEYLTDMFLDGSLHNRQWSMGSYMLRYLQFIRDLFVPWLMIAVGSPSLPHADVGASSQNAERYFSSGNERTKIRMDEAGAEGTKAGYHLKTSDRFAFIGETSSNDEIDSC